MQLAPSSDEKVLTTPVRLRCFFSTSCKCTVRNCPPAGNYPTAQENLGALGAVSALGKNDYGSMQDTNAARTVSSRSLFKGMQDTKCSKVRIFTISLQSAATALPTYQPLAPPLLSLPLEARAAPLPRYANADWAPQCLQHVRRPALCCLPQHGTQAGV